MAKYGKKSQEKVKKVMEEMKQGKLKTGTGKKVKSRKQAIAIGLSEARKAGGKVPSAPKKSKTAQRGSVKRTASGRKKTSRSKSKK